MSSFVPFTSDADILAIAQCFIDRTIARSRWTHAAHFAAALCLMEQGRISSFPSALRAYNEAVEVANTDRSGYHETITQASIPVALASLIERKGQPLFQVCNELMASSLGHHDWLLAYWSRDGLFSTEALRR